MSNRFWLTSDSQQRRLFVGSTTLNKRETARRFGTVVCVLMLLGCVLLLSGCATPQTQPCETQPLPTPPALSEQPPSPSYSTQWRALAESLRAKLTGIPATP